MTRTYHYEATVCLGGDGEDESAEFDVKASFTVAWGSPETGRFGPVEGYDPGAGDEIEDIKLLTVNGKARPWDMGYGFLSDDAFAEMVIEMLEAHHAEHMLHEAAEEDDGQRDQAAEYRAEAAAEALAEGW